MPGGLTPLEYAQSRFPSETHLHEIIANPQHYDEEEEELHTEQRRKQMYDSRDFVDGKIFVYLFSLVTFTRYLPDDEDKGSGSATD